MLMRHMNRFRTVVVQQHPNSPVQSWPCRYTSVKKLWQVTYLHSLSSQSLIVSAVDCISVSSINIIIGIMFAFGIIIINIGNKGLGIFIERSFQSVVFGRHVYWVEILDKSRFCQRNKLPKIRLVPHPRGLWRTNGTELIERNYYLGIMNPKNIMHCFFSSI